MMKLRTPLLVSLLGVACAAQASSLVATHSYQIENKSGYTYKADNKFFNFGKSGSYNSFGVLDFSASSLSGLSITGATLNLTDSTYTSSKQTVLTIWAVTDTATSLAAGQTTVGYDDSAAPSGYDGQLGTATQLGQFTFVPDTSNINKAEVVNLAGLSALNSQIGTGTLRLLITSDQLGLGTFGGVGAGTPGAPTLAVTTSPEPASMLALGLGVAVLIRRRRKA